MTSVHFERVSFTYPDSNERVLDDVSLRIDEGSFVLVTGDTGAGKSTFIRAINGLVPHFTGGEYSGSVTLRGDTIRNTLDNAPRDLADLVAFVPQDPSAAFVVDRVEDEIAYSLENLGVERTVMRRRVEETLDALEHRGAARPKRSHTFRRGASTSRDRGRARARAAHPAARRAH